MLETETATGDGFAVNAKYPTVGWYAAPAVVPALRSPHELCAISNRPLKIVPSTSEENRPAIDELDPASMFIWVYYEVLGDPVIGDPTRPPIPDYSRFSYPFVYRESEVFAAQTAYNWSSSSFQWRRVGLNIAPTASRPQPTALTVMVWEGTKSSAADVSATDAIVRSITVSNSVGAAL
jgi:hypothetical protein